MSEESSSDHRQDVTDEELLEALSEAESPVLTTAEVADRDNIPISQGEVLKRLTSLEKQGRVGSKLSEASRERIWWHEGVSLKKAWPGTGDPKIPDTIGVDAVDILDLPGRNEKLRKRREAVSAVFKYLFDEQEGSKRELQLVGWGADTETYDSPSSLWNNCLKKALDQSQLFLLHVTEKEWRLSELGKQLREISTRIFWDDWETINSTLNYNYHLRFWLLIRNIDDSRYIRHTENKSKNKMAVKGKDAEIIQYLSMDGPVWRCSAGEFSQVLKLSDDPEQIENIINAKDRIESVLDGEVSFQRERSTEARSESLELECTRTVDVDRSRLLEQTNFKEDPGPPLTELQQWERETRNTLVQVANNDIP